jgi:hypothetical protein
MDSVFGEIGEVALDSPIPTHPGDGVLPPTLHRLEGTGVRVIATCNHIFQMTILCLDDRVSRVSLQPIVTRPTHLLTCHRLHELTAFFGVFFGMFVPATACSYALS